MIFFPSTYPDGYWDTAALSAASPFVVEDCFFAAEDGVKLHGWWCGRSQWPEVDQQRKVLLFFHGNAGNLSHRTDLILRLVDLGVEVLAVDYRGYGRSQGRPTEAGVYRDGKAAWAYLRESRRVEAGRIVIFGKSLGGAVAIDLAAATEPAGLIVQSSFTSIAEMASYHYPFVPGVLVRTKMDSMARIDKVSCAKLFIHSPADEIVPFAMGRRLFEAASPPKIFFEVPDARHNETWVKGGEAYFERLGSFINSL